MSKQLNRYQSPEVIDHLASQYVLGTLGKLVKRRVEGLRNSIEALDQRIYYWENHMSPLLDSTPELAPKPETWDAIQNRIAPAKSRETQKAPFWESLLLGWKQVSLALSVMFVALLGYVNFSQVSPELSYIAVLNDEQQNPTLVAATYGESRKLVLDYVNLPNLDEEQSLELWVTSKTDKQARSLGVLPVSGDNFERELTVAEWRLIKDSDELLLTLEEAGGSPFGEPSEELVSRGFCIQLSAWNENV